MGKWWRDALMGELPLARGRLGNQKVQCGMFDVMDSISQWMEQGQAVALATVVQTWGSAPRRAGAKLGLTRDLAMVGSVSGGCVETAVVDEGVDSLDDRQPRLLHFTVSDDNAWQVGLACGGSMWVYVEPLEAQWWQVVAAAVRSQRPTVAITVLEGAQRGHKLVVDGLTRQATYVTPGLSAEQQAALIEAGLAVLAARATQRATVAGLDALFDVYAPLPRLIVIGGAHVAMALQTLARAVGFRMVLVDPRTAFATPERFREVEAIVHSYPDKALPALGLDADSYLVVLTHDPKIDDPALKVGLQYNLPYIGVMSSRKTHAGRLQRLREAGFSDEQLARIRAPIGLNIGAQTPEEIALCILAEVVAVRNGAAQRE